MSVLKASRLAGRLWGLGVFVALGTLTPCTSSAQAKSRATPQAGLIVRDSIPGTLVSFELVYVPGASSAQGGKPIPPLYFGRTEVTWDMYDVYMHRLDSKRSNPKADAVARPSMPYAVPDYDWGHAGYAAISITYHAAQAFAEWLSAKTGHRYRLPTEAEWLHAATLASGNNHLTRARLDSIAWHRGNADGTTHPIASKQPDALGLYDLFGNVTEWVVTGEAIPVTRGGSFRTAPDSLGPSIRLPQTKLWTERDPQLPSSRWWLTDGPFVGFRLVREP